MAAERPPHETLTGSSGSPAWRDALHEEVCGVAPPPTTNEGPLSPATTVSLLDQTLDGMHKLLSPSGAHPPRPNVSYQETDPPALQPQDITFIFSKFAEMLDRGLAQTASRITSDIKADLQLLGSRIENIENKVDATIDRVNQNTDRFKICMTNLRALWRK